MTPAHTTSRDPVTGVRWWQRPWLAGLGLVLAAWLLYLPTVRYGFVDFDDVRILRNHPELYGQARLTDDLRAIFLTAYPREEPLLLRDVTWAIDSRIFGFGNPLGYHLGNVLLHGVVVGLMFAVLLGTTRRPGFALATTAGWLVLAVHTEPVAWIMGRKDLLATLCLLLALGAQLRRYAAANSRARWGWYAVTLICLVAALLSKINALVFPLVLFLHVIFLPFLRGESAPAAALPPWRTLTREGWLLLPGLAVSGVVYVWYRHTLEQMGVLDRGYTAHGLQHLWNLLMMNPLVLWLYLRETFLPAHLAVIYNWPLLQPVFPAGQIIVALGTWGGIAGAGVWLFRYHKHLFFYFSTFFVLMIPYLNLVYMGIWAADRYIYFSSICLLALAVIAAETAWRRPWPILRAGVLTAITFFAAVNLLEHFTYQPAWRNGETLWMHHITQPNPSPTAYENLAASYYAEAIAGQNTPRRALALRKMAVAVDGGLTEFWPDQHLPPPSQIYYLLFLRAIVQEVNGAPGAALDSLLTSDRLRPGFDATQLNLSRLYHKLASTTADPRQRETSLLAARDRLLNYIALAFHGRPAPPDIQQELAGLEAECAALPHVTHGGASQRSL